MPKRLVLEAKEEDRVLSWNGACVRVGMLVGVHGDTLRTWVTRHQVDGGQRPGTTSDDGKRIRELERGVKELKRANEILLAGARVSLLLTVRSVTVLVVEFIDRHEVRFGVEPVGCVFKAHGFKIAPSTYYAHLKRGPSGRALSNAHLMEVIEAVWSDPRKGPPGGWLPQNVASVET